MPTQQQQVNASETESRVLDSLDEAVRLLSSIDEPLTTEVDLQQFIDEVGLRQSPLPPVVDEHGFDCRVFELPVTERIPVATEACPVCGECTATPRFAVDGLPYCVVVCEECGLGRLDPPPTQQAVASFYPSEYYGTSGAKFRPLVEAMVRVVGARHVRSLARGLDQGARVLDVGCGRGVLLSALADRGFEAHGFEISPTAAAGVDSRAKIRIADELRDAKYPDAHFDQVILWHVFEHLANPRETLDEIFRILRPGGRVVIAVPNFSSLQARWAGAAWFHLDLPRHLFHFPLAALNRLIADCGFQPRSEHHFSLRQNPFGWVQSALNASHDLPRNMLYRMLKRGDFRADVSGQRGRWAQWAAYYLGMPLALGLSVVEAMLGQGASVCVMAEKVDPSADCGWVDPSISSL